MKILILTNGTYGDYNFCKQDEGFDYIICADRGLCHARVLGIMPNLIVGDFDSTNEQDLTYFKEQGVQIETFDTHKDETDTEIAVSKAIQKGATEVTIYGGLGSRLDVGIQCPTHRQFLRQDAGHTEMVELDCGLCVHGCRDLLLYHDVFVKK